MKFAKKKDYIELHKICQLRKSYIFLHRNNIKTISHHENQNNKEIPFGGKVKNGFGMLAVVFL